MNAFLWTMVIVFAFDVVGRVGSLGSGSYAEPRTPGAVAADLVINTGFLCWAAFLLWSRYQ